MKRTLLMLLLSSLLLTGCSHQDRMTTPSLATLLPHTYRIEGQCASFTISGGRFSIASAIAPHAQEIFEGGTLQPTATNFFQNVTAYRYTYYYMDNDTRCEISEYSGDSDTGTYLHPPKTLGTGISYGAPSTLGATLLEGTPTDIPVFFELIITYADDTQTTTTVPLRLTKQCPV